MNNFVCIYRYIDRSHFTDRPSLNLNDKIFSSTNDIFYFSKKKIIDSICHTNYEQGGRKLKMRLGLSTMMAREQNEINCYIQGLSLYKL